MAGLKQLPFSGVHVFDADPDDSEATEQSSTSADDPHKPKARGRGRPKGSRGRISENYDLTLSDFAYLRAVVQGIDPKKAALRCLSGKVYPSASACAQYENRLRSILQRTIKVLLDEVDQKKAVACLSVVNAPTLKASPMALPSKPRSMPSPGSQTRLRASQNPLTLLNCGSILVWCSSFDHSGSLPCLT